MCTVTWYRDADGYEIFFNRDERRTRQPALPPRIQSHHGVRFVAPVDGDAGGTWLAANERGLTVGLLNFYEAAAAARPPQPVSRGLLVFSLLDRATAADVLRELEGRDLDRYPPFVLVAFDAAEARLARWNGQQLEARALADADRPLSTSSYDTAGVLERRAARFVEGADRKAVTPQLLDAYHRSTDVQGGAYSVWMTREDAQTVSYSRVRVARDRVSFYYEPREPEGLRGNGETVELMRT